MDKRIINNIFIGALVAVIILSLLKYLVSFKEKQDLARSLNETKQQLASLEIEKENLLQTLEKVKHKQEETQEKNILLKENLEASKRRLAKIFNDYQEVQKGKEEVSAEYSNLKAENRLLREDRQELFQENESMKLKLNSITELKKAISELKRKMRQTKLEIKEKKKQIEDIEGNRGFIIKDGKSTYPARIIIEVIPAT